MTHVRFGERAPEKYQQWQLADALLYRTSGSVRGGDGNIPTYSARDRWRRDPGRGQNCPQTGAAVGERGQPRAIGSAHRLQVAADQRGDVGLGPRDSAEHLPAPALRLDVADANLQVSLASVAASDER